MNKNTSIQRSGSLGAPAVSRAIALQDQTISGSSKSGQQFCENVRASQVDGQNSEIANAIDRLQRVADSLQSRLASIVISRDEDNSAKPCAPDAMLVPLADLLRTHSRRINSAAERLENLLNNIEL